MKAFIYIRVSTEEQAMEGKSVETQERVAREWAKNNNYEIVGVYADEGKSGSNTNRPALKDMLASCKSDKDVDAIIVQDTDRLARNTTDHLTIKALLKKSGIKVISISQPMIDDSPEGNLVDTIIAGVNAFQSQITGRKTSKVLIEKAKIGWFPGGIPPLGYKNADNPNPIGTLDKKIITIDEPVALHIRKIFNMYATGKYNVNQIADYLNSNHIKPPHGTKVHTSLANRTLQNKFYIGKFLWKETEYAGKHEPLVPTPLFNQVQAVLRAHNQNATRKRRHDFLLRGYLWCNVCGHRFWGEQHNKKGTLYSFYFCSHCKKDTYTDKDKTEKQVAKIFRKIQISEATRNTLVEKAKFILQNNRDNQTLDRKRLETEKAKLERAMHEAEDNRFISKTLSEEAFQRIYPRYEGELKIVEEALSKVGKDYSDSIHKLNKILKLAENIGDAYQQANPILKKTYLGIFFQKFMFENGKIVAYNLNPKIKPLIEKGSIRVSTTGLPR